MTTRSTASWAIRVREEGATAPLPLDDVRLDFALDRPETGETLRAKLAGDPASIEWLRTAAWLMREARVEQVWPFLSLETISAQFSRIAPLLGRRRPVWEHLLRSAHELGRLDFEEGGFVREKIPEREV